MSHAVLDGGNDGAEQADGPKEVTERTAVDIEDRKQTESLRAAETRTLEMIANGANLSDVLNDLCAAIDDHASATSFVCFDGYGRQATIADCRPSRPTRICEGYHTLADRSQQRLLRHRGVYKRPSDHSGYLRRSALAR
jgi:hypothetical protein